MSLTLSLIAGALPCLAAYLVLTARHDAAQRSWTNHTLDIGASIGLGCGLSSCGYLLWRLCCGTAGANYVLADCIGWTCLTVLALVIHRRRRVCSTNTAETGTCTHQVLRPVLLAAIGILVMGFSGAVLHLRANASGGWDAWAIWNLRARALYRMEGIPRAAWSAEFDHPDYPLLIPATIARWWTMLGTESQTVPQGVALLFTLATAAVLVGGIARLRSVNQGLLAGIVLFGTVRFVRWGSAQYADVPLAFFYLSTLIILVEYETGRPQRWSLCLAGMSAALAAWTKNEGLLFLVAVFCIHSFVQGLRLGWKHCARESLLMGCGAAPILIALAAFKGQLSVANDLIEGQTLASSVGRLIDLSRHAAILLAFVRTILQVGSAFTFILPACLVLLGAVPRGHVVRRAVVVPCLILVGMLSGYYVVYLTTPHDLPWHLETSLDRLMVQLWPAALFTVFLYLRTPEEVLELQPEKRSRSVWQQSAEPHYAQHDGMSRGPHRTIHTIHH